MSAQRGSRVTGYLCWLAFCALAVAQVGRVETVGPPPAAEVSPDVLAALQKDGYRVALADGTLVAEVWLRALVPSQANSGESGVLYDQLAQSTFLGVIHFPAHTSDYRGQSIAAGFYTLRYALMPSDGSHLGAAPSRDFLLLSPAAADADPKATLKPAALNALSSQAAGSKHPAPLSLIECSEGKPARLGKDDQERLVFSASVKLSNGSELPFALVVKGVAAQ
jgi:hypothetical protein